MELCLVPAQAAVVITAEEVQVLCLSQVDLGMAYEDFVQPGRTGLTRSQVKEVDALVGHVASYAIPRPKIRAARLKWRGSMPVAMCASAIYGCGEAGHSVSALIA